MIIISICLYPTCKTEKKASLGLKKLIKLKSSPLIKYPLCSNPKYVYLVQSKLHKTEFVFHRVFVNLIIFVMTSNARLILREESKRKELSHWVTAAE